MNIFLQFANEVFKASQKLEDAIKTDFNTPELLETNKPKDDRDGAIWKFGQLGNVLSVITPRSGDGPVAKLYSKCLAVCHTENLADLKSLLAQLHKAFQQVVDEYKYSWEEQELSIPSLLELNRLLNEVRLNTQHLPPEHLLAPAKSNTPRKRGRIPATKKVQKEEKKTADDWKRAKSAGLSRTEFASDKGLTPHTLDLLLRRVAKRETPK